MPMLPDLTDRLIQHLSRAELFKIWRKCLTDTPPPDATVEQLAARLGTATGEQHRRILDAAALIDQNVARGSTPPPPAPTRSDTMTTNLRPTVHAVILTMKEEEMEAVLDHFGDTTTHNGKRRDYEIATISFGNDTVTVAITRTVHQGNIHAQAAAVDAIEDLAPGFLLVVGIAGGVPSGEFTLGDVIVSSFIHDLTLEDTGTGNPRYNALGGPLHPEANRIVGSLPALRRKMGWSPTRARPSTSGEHTTQDEAWNKKIDDVFKRNQRDAPIMRAERVAASDRLIKDPDLIQHWQQVLKGIAAVEMESAGAYVTCHERQIPFLAIRGISDIVGWKRDEAWTLYACDTAAACARALAGTGVFGSVSASAPTPSGAVQAASPAPAQATAAVAELSRDKRYEVLVRLMPGQVGEILLKFNEMRPHIPNGSPAEKAQAILELLPGQDSETRQRFDALLKKMAPGLFP